MYKLEQKYSANINYNWKYFAWKEQLKFQQTARS